MHSENLYIYICTVPLVYVCLLGSCNILMPNANFASVTEVTEAKAMMRWWYRLRATPRIASSLIPLFGEKCICCRVRCYAPLAPNIRSNNRFDYAPRNGEKIISARARRRWSAAAHSGDDDHHTFALCGCVYVCVCVLRPVLKRLCVGDDEWYR